MACETNYNEEARIWTGRPEDFDAKQPIGRVILENLRARGHKVMQIFDDTMESMTASELYRRSCKLAAQFQLHGVRQGDIVSFHLQHLPDSTPMVVALFAVGAVLNVLDRNNLCAPPSVERSFLRMVQPKFVVCHVDAVEEVLAHKAMVACAAEVITFERMAGYVSVEDMLMADEADECEFT